MLTHTRNLNEGVKQRLREIAAQYGLFIRKLHGLFRFFRCSVYQESEKGLGSLIVEQFSAIGGVELEIPSRSPMRLAPRFEVEDE